MTRPATPGADAPQCTEVARLTDLFAQSIDLDIEDILVDEVTTRAVAERVDAELTPVWWRTVPMNPEPLTFERVQEGMRRAMETCGRGVPAPALVPFTGSRVFTTHHYDALRYFLYNTPRVNFGALLADYDPPPRLRPRGRGPRAGERVYTSRPRRGQRSLFDE